MLSKDQDNGLLPRRAFSSDLYTFFFLWNRFVKSSIMDFNNFFVGKSRKHISEFENISNWRGGLSIRFVGQVFAFFPLFHAFPNFFQLFAGQVSRNGGGNFFNQISFARV